MSENKRIWIVTLFPQLFTPFFDVGVAGQTFSGNRGHRFQIETINPAAFSPRDFKGVDDSPYGGGQGMVMRADVLKAALDHIVSQSGFGPDYREKLKVIYTGPRGVVWDNQCCKDFSKKHWGEISHDLVFICGRYEGIDERFLIEYVDETYSIGDYVLTGGELAVMVILDSAIRFVDGSLGHQLSAQEDSFNDGLVEHPQYTRPKDFEGSSVPDILLSGDHKKIAAYRFQEKLEATKKYRPDLYQKYLAANGKKGI